MSYTTLFPNQKKYHDGPTSVRMGAWQELSVLTKWFETARRCVGRGKISPFVSFERTQQKIDGLKRRVSMFHKNEVR